MPKESKTKGNDGAGAIFSLYGGQVNWVVKGGEGERTNSGGAFAHSSFELCQRTSGVVWRDHPIDFAVRSRGNLDHWSLGVHVGGRSEHKEVRSGACAYTKQGYNLLRATSDISDSLSLSIYISLYHIVQADINNAPTAPAKLNPLPSNATVLELELDELELEEEFEEVVFVNVVEPDP